MVIVFLGLFRVLIVINEECVVFVFLELSREEGYRNRVL